MRKSSPARSSLFQPRVALGRVAAALALVGSSVAAQARVQRLNDPLLRGYLGSVRDWAVTTSGNVVFSTQPFGTHQALFATSIDGSSPVLELSLPNTFPLLGEIRQVSLTPDGSRGVYEVELFDESHMLYSVPVDGSQGAASIGPAPFSSNQELAHRLSPDSTRAVYVEEFLDFTRGLFTSPVDGSSGPVPISGGLLGSDPRAFEISSNSSRIVFVADRDSDGVRDLFRAPLDGSASPVRLSPLLPPGRSVGRFHVSPDSSRVVYLADQDSDDVVELYSVPLEGGGAALKLSGALVAGGNVDGAFAISADSSRVVYLADQEVDERFELFTVPLDGSASAQKLSGTPVPQGDVLPFFAISADSSRVVYLADQDADERYELYSVPLDASAVAVRLNATLVADGDVLSDFEISADSSRVVYCADQVTNGMNELFAVPIDASAAAIRLNAALGPNRDVHDELGAGGGLGRSRISPDSSRVVYRADANVDQRFELFSVPIDASTPAVRLGPECQVGQTLGWVFGPGNGVALALEFAMPGAYELFASPLDAGLPAVNLCRAPAFVDVTGDVDRFATSPDGRHVVYDAALQRDSCSGRALYAVALDAPLESVNLTAPVSSPVLMGIGEGAQRVIFTGASPPGLHSAPIDGSSPPVQLGSLAVATHLPSPVVLTPQGTTVLFLAVDGGWIELFAVPSDGSTAPRQLSAALVTGGKVDKVLVDPRGRLAVYRADQRADEVFELFCVPVDGSLPPRRLNPALVAGGDVGTAEISADGRRVVYLADQVVNGVTELFSVPLRATPRAASRTAVVPEVKLDPALVPGGDVVSFRIDPESVRVVYLADQELDERFELFSVPIDGSAVPVKLNASLAPGGDVSSYRIARDGSRVLYAADQATDEVLELFVVPIDGSAGPVRLNAPLVAGGDLLTNGLTGEAFFRFSPDGSRALYIADQELDERFELYSVPSDGSATPVKLNLAPVTNGDVYTLEISADSERVVYLADQAVDTILELYSVPIKGGQAPTRVNAALVPNQGQVLEFAIAARGDRVVYRADQEVDEQFELFLKYLPRRAP